MKNTATCHRVEKNNKKGRAFTVFLRNVKLPICSIVFALLFVSGCGDDCTCTLELKDSIVLKIYDGQNGTTLVTGASVEMANKSYAGMLHEVTYGEYRGPYEMIGTFEFKISHNHYKTKTLNGVVIEGNCCGVITKYMKEYLDVK